MKRGKVTVYPRKVRLTIGEPMPVEGLTEADAGTLSERVRDVVRRTLEEPASRG
jgi:1-acyl-sn-glycerol-3-phosphate acyltransferase